MKRLALIFSYIVAGIVCQWSSASDDFLPIVQTKPAPADVRAYMPHGGESLRYGTSKFGQRRHDVLFHVYKLKDISYLDLFERIRKSQSHKLKRLNSVRLDAAGGDGGIEDPSKGSFKTLWLDPERRHIPIITVNGLGSGGFAEGWCLYIFPKGLTGGAVKQTFWTSFSGTRGYSLGGIDGRGFLTIRQTDGVGVPTTPDNTPEQREEYRKHVKETVLQWNGKRFAEPPKKQ